MSKITTPDWWVAINAGSYELLRRWTRRACASEGRGCRRRFFGLAAGCDCGPGIFLFWLFLFAVETHHTFVVVARPTAHKIVRTCFANVTGMVVIGMGAENVRVLFESLFGNAV